MSSPLEQARSILEPLVDQPLTQRLLSDASALRDRTLRLQEATLAALNLPTAADVAKLERRLRSLADTMVRLDEHLDRVETRLRRTEPVASGVTLEELKAEIVALREQIAKG